MLRTFVLLLVLLFCGGRSALAEQTVVFAVSADLPPMEFLDKNGAVTGFAVDMMRAAGRIAGFKAEFKAVAREGLAAGLQEGQFDAICSSAPIGGEELQGMDLSSSYYVAREVMLVNDATAIYSTTSLAGKRIGVLPATRTEGLVGASIRTYASLATAMEDLYVNRLDGVISDSAVGTYFATVKYQDKLKVTGYLGEGQKVNYGVAVKKGNQPVLALLNQGISGVKARAVDKELQLKWFSR